MENKEYVSCKKCQCEITNRVAEKYDGYCKNCFNATKKLYKTNKYSKTSILVVLILFFVVVGIIGIHPVTQMIHKNALSNKVKNTLLNNIDYIDFDIEGKYNNHLEIQMNDEFDDYDYTKKEQMIKDISNQFKEVYREDEEKFINTDNENYIYDEIKGNTKPTVTFISKNNKYTIDTILLKNDKQYTKNDDLKEKIIEQLNSSDIENKDELVNMVNSTNFEEEGLNSILNISDNIEKSNEIIYQSAKVYSSEDYKKSLELYQRILDYKDSKDIIEKINKSHEVDGEWYGKYAYTGHRWIISGNTCYNVYSDYKHKYTYDTYYCKYEDNILYVFKEKESSNDNNNAKFKMKYENGSLTYLDEPYYNTITLNKQSDNTIPKEIVEIKEPSLGMTKNEVRNSTWGEPEDINKTTTAYGTREQWCYSGYKYIYFEDGIVTSIQD